MKIAVIGAGVMGSGMAQCLAVNGYEVACHDVDGEQLERARTAIEDGRFGLVRAVERGKLTAEQAAAARERLFFTSVFDEAVAGVGFAIEAVPERIDLKVEVLRKLDGAVPAGAVLATNTSGLCVEALATALARPERLVGWHWASPPAVMKMAEIVATPIVDAAALELVVEMARACGKRPVVVRDNAFAWGFAANRVITAMVREARAVVEEGLVDKEGLDALLVSGWGWPVGPFAMTEGAAGGWGDGWSSSIKQIADDPRAQASAWAKWEGEHDA